MNKAPWIFLGVLFTLSLSWWGMIYGPAAQLGGQSAANDDGTAVLPRVGLARQGEQVYRANGCYYCHTRTATGGEFGYELRLTQFGDSYEMTEKIIGHTLQGREADRNVVRLAFEFKAVAKAKKAADETVQAVADHKQSVVDNEKLIDELGKKESLAGEEKGKLAEARKILQESTKTLAGLEQAARIATETTLPAAIGALKDFLANHTQGMTQEQKDTVLFTAYGLSGVELKEKELMVKLDLGEQIVEGHKKIADNAALVLTKGVKGWNEQLYPNRTPRTEVRLKDLVRGLKNRAGAQFKLQPVAIHWPDVQNNVSRRQSVARDFMHDAHALPGVMRLGPDLSNVGTKLMGEAANDFYVHLYTPRLKNEKSAMPPYRYLFEKKKLNPGEAAPKNALEHADLEEGYAIVPTAEAEALFEFLKSLRTDTALPEAPLVELPPTTQAKDNE